VIGTGFIHHQVRKMMTVIWEIVKGNWELKDIQERLKHLDADWEQIPPAPSNGLIL
jgi:tRNA pseudouridine38-40 synthase|tara:strand:+ start:222 stop:389 length:168 start_codon:yes stop_codon:yes gene_type:complete